MGSYLAHVPKIYPKAHENRKAFSCISSPIFLESSNQCPWGRIASELRMASRFIFFKSGWVRDLLSYVWFNNGLLNFFGLEPEGANWDCDIVGFSFSKHFVYSLIFNLSLLFCIKFMNLHNIRKYDV